MFPNGDDPAPGAGDRCGFHRVPPVNWLSRWWRAFSFRLFINYTLLLFAGTFAAAGVAWLVGLGVPWLRGWVFIGLCLWWYWTGWRYSGMQGRRDAD